MKVQILTTPGCTNCAKVKEMLNAMKVKYEVIDVTKNPDILQKYPIRWFLVYLSSSVYRGEYNRK